MSFCSVTEFVIIS